MERTEVFEALKTIMIDDTYEDFSTMQDGDSLRGKLGLDSVDVVSIVTQVERRFRIRLTMHELEKLVTVGNVVDIVHEKVKQLAIEGSAESL